MNAETSRQLLARAIDHHASGGTDAAAILYGRALALEPTLADAANNLAVILLERGESAGALAVIDRARAAGVARADIETNRGNVLAALGRAAEAVTAYRRALELGGERATVLTNLAATLLDLDDAPGAVRACREALAIAPTAIDAWINLSGALTALGDFAAAAGAAESALALDADQPRAWLNLGVARDRVGDFAGAERSYQEALRRAPGLAEASFNRAVIALRRGAFALGWPGYEARLAVAPPLVGRVWRGESLAGASLLLQAEQGFGDTVQFIRYAAPLADRGATIIARVPEPLAKLVATAPGVARVVTFDAPPPGTDFILPLPSAPGALGVTLEDIGPRPPYLFADAIAIAEWRRRLAGGAARVAGLVWAGRPTHRTDRQRSLDLATLAPALAAPGWRFVSLQKGPATARAAAADLPDLGAELESFADTAALMMALDLVISVDTATAHLAGALGRPVAVLLPCPSDWRWLEDRDDSPWYPSARLFRQTVAGDWAPVIEALTTWLGAGAN